MGSPPLRSLTSAPPQPNFMSSSAGLSARATSSTTAGKRKYGLSGEGPATASGASLPAGQAGADIKRSFELSLAPMLSELTRTVSSWEARSNQTLSALVLKGGGATLRGLKEFMQSKITTEIRLADPFAKTQAPAFLEAILKDAGPEFSVAVGLALRRLQEMG